MGLAFHPDFTSQPYVYVAHSYQESGSLRNRLVRMRWGGQSLGAPEVLLAGIPASSIHDGSRLAADGKSVTAMERSPRPGR